MRGQDNVAVEHHGSNPPPGRLGALALSMLDTLLHRHTPPSPNSKSKVSPWSRRSRNSRVPTARREDRSRYEARSRQEGHSTRERNTTQLSPAGSFRRSSSVQMLQAAWSTRKLHKPSISTRSFQSSKVAVNNVDKEEAPEVVSNYVYDMPEKKVKPRSDYDDNDELESDDFDHDLDDDEEEELDDLDFEMRPFISEDEDEMAYFAHRLGGSDFKMLRRHVLHPHGRIRSIWDTITLFLTTWVLIIVPFELCFDMNNAIRSNLLHLDLFIDSLFLVDILLNFNTAVEDDGKLHFSLTSIFRHYIRGWFVPELLFTIPFYAIFEWHDPEAYVKGRSASNSLFRFAVQAAWLYPAARCLRLMRVIGLPRLQRRLEYSLLISSKVSSLGSFLFVVLSLSHVFSCVFAYLAFNDDDQLELALGARVLQDSEVKTRYIAAFYWSMMTMTTVGYGDITVKTNAGRLFSIAAMIVGGGVFAYGITNVVSLFQQLYESDTAYRRDMDQINVFMQDRMLSRALRDKVRANTFHWRKAARGENKERDRAIVERMASVIRTKVADRFCEDMMPKKMPFLAGCSAEFIHDLYLRMHVQCYLPGEDIISQGDYGSEMYFLFVGHAQVLLGLTKVALFGPNTCFGEFSIANPRKPRLATIQALDFCETHCIDREQILRVLLSHPITMRSARQLATLRSRKALTLIYESGGKSRTLLQGLAMMWRAEGVEAVLPAGVAANSLPFLQEFAVAPKIGRRSSAMSSSRTLSFGNAQLQPNHMHFQQHVEANHVLQPQPLVANPPALIPQHLAISTGSARRLSSVLDPAVALAATQGLVSAPTSSLPSPSHQRGRNGVIRLPKINTDGSIRADLPSTEKETPTIRQESPLRRRKSATNVANGISPETHSLLLREPESSQLPVDRLDSNLELLLTEIRNVASRQNDLEQQLRAMMERPQPQPQPDSLRRVPSVGMLGDRFDEQHWIDDHAPPLVRQRTHRRSLTLPHDGAATEKSSPVEKNRT